jgi:hypothetical protein
MRLIESPSRSPVGKVLAVVTTFHLLQLKQPRRRAERNEVN